MTLLLQLQLYSLLQKPFVLTDQNPFLLALSQPKVSWCRNWSICTGV
uniref:Uncharacterized protein n=1 Tax=Arundo donax TaxID=35708 RepID=A0A0A8ZLI0_ARUDO